MFHTDIDCIANGAPHQAATIGFMEKIRRLSKGADTFPIRTLIAWEMFQRTELILEIDGGSVEPFIALLAELGDMCTRFSTGTSTFAHKLDFGQWVCAEADFREHTAEHYGNLFKAFDDKHYYDEATQLLKQRLERNGIDLGDIGKMKALDAGCGGGRYSFALKSLGFGEVVGVDFSDINIETANRRAEASKLKGLSFQKGNVLDLPFADASFDFVFSNGVIHHTESIAQGVAEIARVMKPKASGWLYVIEKPGGLHWDMVEILRNVMQPVDKAYARALFKMLGVPTNRVFYMLDHVMVPVNTRLTPQEIEMILKENGLMILQRLARGTDFDRAERIHSLQGKLTAKEIEWKWGAGENRYLFARP